MIEEETTGELWDKVEETGELWVGSDAGPDDTVIEILELNGKFFGRCVVGPAGGLCGKTTRESFDTIEELREYLQKHGCTNWKPKETRNIGGTYMVKELIALAVATTTATEPERLIPKEVADRINREDEESESLEDMYRRHGF